MAFEVRDGESPLSHRHFSFNSFDGNLIAEGNPSLPTSSAIQYGAHCIFWQRYDPGYKLYHRDERIVTENHY